MTADAVPRRWRKPRLRLIKGSKQSEGHFRSDSELEFLGPHDFIGCEWAPGNDGVILMSEPDLGDEEEDTPEREAAHAAWLKEYCEKHRSKDT